jgi:hypothetical protein
MSLSASLIDATEAALVGARGLTLREVVTSMGHTYPQSDVEEALAYLVKTGAANVREASLGRVWALARAERAAA